MKCNIYSIWLTVVGTRNGPSKQTLWKDFWRWLLLQWRSMQITLQEMRPWYVAPHGGTSFSNCPQWWRERKCSCRDEGWDQRAIVLVALTTKVRSGLWGQLAVSGDSRHCIQRKGETGDCEDYYYWLVLHVFYSEHTQTVRKPGSLVGAPHFLVMADVAELCLMYGLWTCSFDEGTAPRLSLSGNGWLGRGGRPRRVRD